MRNRTPQQLLHLKRLSELAKQTRGATAPCYVGSLVVQSLYKNMKEEIRS